MKKFVYTSALVFAFALALVAFKGNSNSEATTANAMHMTNINNMALYMTIETNFSPIISEVASVSAYKDYDDNSFFYLVEGFKNDTPTTFMLKIDEQDYVNQTYTYIDFSNITINDNTQFCTTRGASSKFLPAKECSPQDNTLAKICAVFQDGNCL
ncbi:hypothetical protein GCM10009117_15240 [Gangjinia marincola]|uniref:Uncharacterized protein n=3 Tax=Gangjinia marincola TaxID=578463 RepID=A0ABN1MH03_9FLAO